MLESNISLEKNYAVLGDDFDKYGKQIAWLVNPDNTIRLAGKQTIATGIADHLEEIYK